MMHHRLATAACRLLLLLRTVVVTIRLLALTRLVLLGFAFALASRLRRWWRWRADSITTLKQTKLLTLVNEGAIVPSPDAPEDAVLEILTTVKLR